MKKRNAFLALLLSAAIGLSLPLLAGGQSYWPTAIGDFDGSSDYLSRGSDLVGNEDGQTGIFSSWIRIDGGAGAPRRIMVSAGGRVEVNITAADKIDVTCRDDAAAVKMRQTTTPTYQPSASWIHLLVSWDLAVPIATTIVDGIAPALDTDTAIDATIDYTVASWDIGSTGGAQKFSGAIAELYFGPNQYLDISVDTNLRFFIDRAGFPVPLGISGQLPTGTAPLIYMRTRANNAGINSGTGGDFAINGAPLYSDGPFPFFPLTVPIPERGMGSRIH